eukprot:m.118735 g.118735  ORF g.118735 m.118735 type:complete len:224 (-) comp28693_c0_seq1:341-1012(-)
MGSNQSRQKKTKNSHRVALIKARKVEMLAHTLLSQSTIAEHPENTTVVVNRQQLRSDAKTTPKIQRKSLLGERRRSSDVGHDVSCKRYSDDDGASPRPFKRLNSTPDVLSTKENWNGTMTTTKDKITNAQDKLLDLRQKIDDRDFIHSCTTSVSKADEDEYYAAARLASYSTGNTPNTLESKTRTPRRTPTSARKPVFKLTPSTNACVNWMEDGVPNLADAEV